VAAGAETPPGGDLVSAAAPALTVDTDVSSSDFRDMTGSGEAGWKLSLRASLPVNLGDQNVDSITTGGTNPPAGRPGLFGSQAIAFSNLAARPVWDRLRQRILAGGADSDCRKSICDKGPAHLIGKAAKHEDFLGKLTAVNRGINGLIRYSSDQKLYGRLDHWADPAETLRRRAGDCEDFALLKMAMLSRLGVPARSMSLVILKDTRRDLYHAVLSVSTNRGNFILDNVRDEVLRDANLPQYQPLFSFSDDRSWIHGMPVGAGKRQVAGLGVVVPGEAETSAMAIAEIAGLEIDNPEPVDVNGLPLRR
jgi:predicted transglutaminase-like cysteine proteinase